MNESPNKTLRVLMCFGYWTGNAWLTLILGGAKSDPCALSTIDHFHELMVFFHG